MEFAIGSNYPLNIIRSTNPSEKEMLDSNFLQTKLSYLGVDSIPEVHGEIVEGDKFSILNGESSLIITIPLLIEDERRAAYYLRMVLDANAVKNDCLPLHAAALTDNGLTQFIFGGTRKGKSFTLDRLLFQNRRINPIGDDHIIIGNGSISGNRVMRTRRGENESYSTLHGKQIFPLGNYEIVLIDVTKGNGYLKINKNDIIGRPEVEAAVLKYLVLEPHELESMEIYNKIVSKEILDKYHSNFEKFVGGAKRILGLSRERDYVFEEN